ncbi:hypothetical protein [Enterobacillus tribolii]|uniref:DNA-binding NarL/FixJ family response regulator n=1 Tax=Enterobacillus tribolii TaxID=1487935 RepID=A0A370Q6A8_9GAMM|nr:hypothetical protein [Enterobacillus tribolii]MBW7984966.1 hypothetical protein [Enterobacillus tribolii]RDK83894.1 DNA-binding NarL/FixJ family response regulator [Enterobacillus tribolii]
MTKPTEMAGIVLPSDMHILLFEPYTAVYLGISDILSSAGVKRNHILRVHTMAEIASALARGVGGSILLLSGGHKNANLAELLGFLSDERAGRDNSPVIIRMDNPNPLLMRLLTAFGADEVLPSDCSGAMLLHYLRMVSGPAYTRDGESRFTPRERLIVRHILSGDSLGFIAGLLALDIRQVSEYKQRAVVKLRMDQPHELRLLARLLARFGHLNEVRQP